MLFATQRFLGFFVVVFAVYWLLPRHRWRMLWLLVASCAFYTSWNPLLILLVLFSASVDYIAALLLEKTESPARRKLILTLSVSTNLSLLAFFKYIHFFVSNVHSACNWLGIDFEQPVFQVALPLGISFYTFEAISYIVDVYRGKIRAVRNLLDYALFIMFFPHLIAGPIVRPADFLPQVLRRKRFNWERIEAGARLFLLGLFKKAVLADWLGSVLDPVYAKPGEYGSATVWLTVIAYAFQVYGDFSGYSDMAIGLAHLFGFKLKPNFNMPFLAGNISEFWNRWHMSLSSWLRDYLYIALGGSRRGNWITYRNLLLTMFLCGLWHGASWTFALFGLYNGVLMVLHRMLFPKPRGHSAPYRVMSTAATFLCFAIGLIFFRAATFGDALLIVERLAWPIAGATLALTSLVLIAACLAAMAVGHWVGAATDVPGWLRRLPAPLVSAGLALFLLATFLLIPDDGRLFIYFQF